MPKPQIIAQGSGKHLQIKNYKIDKCFALGAEAIISLRDNEITKNRIKKSYRINEIDEKLRKSRTKSEAKIINKLSLIIPVPKIIKSDDKQEIIMEYIDGKKLSDNLENLDYKKILKIIAENISKMHSQGIIHGDLTTSNMIYSENIDNSDNLHNISSEFSICPILKKRIPINRIVHSKDKSMKTEASLNQSQSQHLDLNITNKSININDNNPKVYFIDFGLAFHSSRIEDEAVDLHLLQQALEAKHFTIWQECWKIILDNYNTKDSKEIKERIKVIESRGRYKDKY